MSYTCSKCSAPAVQSQEGVKPSCSCNAPIVAQMAAKASGSARLR